MPSLSTLTILAGALVSSVLADVTPLSDRRYTYPNGLPYKVDTDATGRGPQAGYNICNSTTEGQSSMCQTALLNSIEDFCVWASPTPNSSIGDVEATTVAWCSIPGHGTRVMPAGTLTGVQVLKAPSYILFTGHLKQTNVGIAANDDGGELDPHGADERGNPLGGLVYTSGFPSNGGRDNTFQQVIEWHNFMGGDVFCFKICDPNVPNSKKYCNNIFDRTGCDFVAPAAYKDGVFEVCESDNMDPVGVYTGSDGKTSTYHQPAEGVPITSLPSIKTPASSSCTPYQSNALYGNSFTISPSAPPSGTGTSTASGTTSTKATTTSQSTSTVTSLATSTTHAATTPSTTSTTTTSKTGGASAIAFNGVATIFSASVLAGLVAAVIAL
ncbi:hypothetical protein DL93DRAFT_2080436 [Clavulina sp. PMI_390]|nr:hypothetical protein DL93DRAFT_2080436 [Clavulina sp. PMI_390]